MTSRIKKLLASHLDPLLVVVGIVWLAYLMAPHVAIMNPYFIILPLILIIALHRGLWSGLLCALVGSYLIEALVDGSFAPLRLHANAGVRILASSAFAGTVGILSDRLRLFRANAENLACRANSLLSLYTMAPQLTEKELYDLALDKAVSLTNSTVGFLHLIADDQQNIILTAWNREALKSCTIPLETHDPVAQAGNWVDCVRQRRPIVYNDFALSPNQKGLPAGHAPLRRFMSIPVMEGELVRIVFGVGNKTGKYDDNDVVQMQLVANELHKIVKQRHSDELLREMTAKADAASAAKSRFLAKMSHELRSPMNAILGMTDLVLMTELTEMQKKYLGFVKSSGLRLLALINDILDLAKIESGKMDLVEEPFCLAEFLNERAITCRTVLGAKPVAFDSVVEEGLPQELLGDPLRLHQILGNLLGNAVKFTECGSIVLVVQKMAQTTDAITLKFSVKDTGPGIPADKIDKLFQYFSQADISVAQKYGGAGLGLLISKELVEKMGGKIGVASELGKGSTFYFTVDFKLPSSCSFSA